MIRIIALLEVAAECGSWGSPGGRPARNVRGLLQTSCEYAPQGLLEADTTTIFRVGKQASLSTIPRPCLQALQVCYLACSWQMPRVGCLQPTSSRVWLPHLEHVINVIP